MKFMEQVSSLKNAIKISAKNAPVRNCGVFRVPYCDVELVDIRHTEEGEPATNTLSSEQAFMKSFMLDYVEKYAAFYSNYIKFKNQVELHQLMPEKSVMSELKELKQAHKAYLQWKDDREASKRDIAANQLSEQQRESMSQE